MRMRFFRRLIVVIVSICCLSALATDDKWPLADKSAVSGGFRQTVRDINGSIAYTSTGQFSATRAGRYRWEINSPDHQLFILNELGFWQWDKDLDVVILRDAPDASTLPLTAIWDGALNRDKKRLAHSDVIPEVGLDSLSVEQISTQTIRVTAVDALGQESIFDLTIDTAIVPSSTEFVLTVPDGADFYDESDRMSSPDRQ